MRRLALFAPLLAAAACGPGPAGVASGPRAIIDGDLEAGYPAVGALVTRRASDGNQSRSFCSSTLIDPSWVLTAAHCVQSRNFVPDGEPDPAVSYLHWFSGTDTATPATGRAFPARAVYVHPGYTRPGGDRHYDLALVELAAPVPDVDPIPIHRGDLSQRLFAEVFYVGFGQSDSAGEESGRKRSTTLLLRSVAPTNYVTAQSNGGVCFGDSGGPGLLDVGGDYEVIGINSTVFGDPTCYQYSTQIRVDAFASWIDATMRRPTSCLDVPESCQCPEACGEDGVCDNTKCGEADCNAVRACASRCLNVLCQVGCFLRATPGAEYRVFEFYDCVQERCPTGSQACADEQCRREQAACDLGYDASVGEGSCGEAYWCSRGCAEGDLACQDACFFDSTIEDQMRREALDTCVRAGCPAGVSDLADAECVYEGCRDALLTCAPDEDCRVAGGDCLTGAACALTPWAATYCLGSAGLTIGEACDPSNVSCADGALCVDLGDGPRCREACASGSDCDVEFAPCVPAVISRLPFSVGVCSESCPDADEDGACDADDCDPTDPTVYPGAQEICDEAGRDEDCDGARNEGCTPAVTPSLETDEGCTCATPKDGAAGLGLVLLLGGLLVRRRGLAVGLATLAGCGGGGDAMDAGPVDAGFADVGFEGWDAGTQPPPSIWRIQQGLIPPDSEVRLEGVVVTSPITAEGFFVAEGAAGPYEGVWVAFDGVDRAQLEAAPGDVVTLRGTVRERAWAEEDEDTTRTRTEVVLTDPADLVFGGAGELPMPTPVTRPELAVPDITERFEGVVVQLEDATVTGADLETGRIVLDDLVLMGGLFAPLDLAWLEPGTRFDSIAGPVQYEDGAFVLHPRGPEDAVRSPASFAACIPDEGYAVCPDAVRWREAREACGAQGGRLVVLETAEENLAVGGIARRWIEGSFWVGLSDQAEEGVWRWVDGSTLSYDPWASGEPNNAGAGEDCVHSNWRGDGIWNDLPCGRRQPYVCEFPGDGVRCEGNADCAVGGGICVGGSCRPG